jgi:serine/threonine-protein kinase
VSFEPGTILAGKYRVDGQLGAGGYGLVVRAHHLLAQQEVAIKILRDDMELDEENRQRFLREAQLMVRLRSEHVAKISDVGTLDSGAPYVVMELLEGMDLGKVLEVTGKLAPRVAADHLLQACDVLAEAHSLGIVHRDIKPTNLFVTRRSDGTPSIKVLDFGISKTAANDPGMKLTQTAMMLGTPAYMSPEQMRSARSVDARTDIWSLGVVLYELVEGTMPFAADSFAELAVKVATEPFVAMTAAPELTQIVARCLGRTPIERYSNVAELAADLAPFATPETARTYTKRIHRVLGLHVPDRFESSPGIATTVRDYASGPVPTPARTRRLWLPITIAAAAVCAVVGIALAVSGGGDTKAESGSAAAAGSAVAGSAAATGSAAAAAAVTGSATATGSAAAAGSATETAAAGSGSAKPPPIRRPPTVRQGSAAPKEPPKPKCDPSRSFNGKCA